MFFALITVLLSPWHGPSLPTAPTGNYQPSYAMNIRGAPRERVALRADGAAKGWVAAFCTTRLCAPFRTVVTLNDKGVARLEFSLIRTDPNAAPHTRVTIQANSWAVAQASS
jgi:hypothetical protein